MTRPTKEIIKDAVRAFAKLEKMKREQRELDNQIRALCLEFGEAERTWSVAPWVLRKAVETRTGKRFNV